MDAQVPSLSVRIKQAVTLEELTASTGSNLEHELFWLPCRDVLGC